MTWLITKYCLTAFVIVAISEIAKRSDRIGGLIAALPLVTILAMIWLFVEGAPQEKIANHARYTFWYVVPTLPMFLFFPALLSRFGFWIALGVAAVITVVCFAIFARLVKRFGIDLMP